MDPLGRFLYADNTNSNTQQCCGQIASFQINPSTGALTLLPWTNAGNYPVAMTVDAFGQVLFNVDEIAGDINAYQIYQPTGEPGAISPFNFPANACPQCSFPVGSSGCMTSNRRRLQR